MPMNCGDLYIGNTFDVIGVFEVDEVAATGGVWTVSVLDSDGDPVTGGDEVDGPETATLGTYTAIIPSTLDVEEGATYEVMGVFELDGNTATFYDTRTAKKRKGGARC